MRDYRKQIDDIETLATYVSDQYTKSVLNRAADAIGELLVERDHLREQPKMVPTWKCVPYMPAPLTKGVE